MPVLVRVGVVGMAGPEAIGEFVVVTRARVRIFNQHADRRTGGAAFEYAGEDPYGVAFAALAHKMRGAGAPPVDVALQVGFAQVQAGRTAIDDAAQRRPVALAKGRYRKQPPDRIA